MYSIKGYIIFSIGLGLGKKTPPAPKTSLVYCWLNIIHLYRRLLMSPRRARLKKKYNNYNNDNIRPRTVPKYASKAVVMGRGPPPPNF